jgi:Rac GTPase-activating protein 1
MLGIPEGKTMSTGAKSMAQLSLTAQFDDLARFSSSVVQHGAYEQELIKLLKSLEEYQAKYGAAQTQLKKYHTELISKDKELKIQEKKLANVRYCLSRETIEKEKIQKQRDALIKKFQVVKEFFLEEEEGQVNTNGMNGITANGHRRERLLSALDNIPQLETVAEGDTDDEALDYDKTEDELHSRGASFAGNLSKRRASSRGGNKSNRDVNKSGREGNKSTRETSVKEVVSKERPNESKRGRYEVELRDFDTDIPDVNMDDADEAVEDMNDKIAELNGMTPVSSPDIVVPTQSTPNLKRTQESVASVKSSTSRRASLRRFQSEKRLETRKHTWQRKKNFKPSEKCSLCSENIRFLGEIFKCSDCLVVGHTHCKSKCDAPCIPMINKSVSRRGVKPALNDFVSESERPKVPALIYHCIKEIERRGMKEEGLYRLSGSRKEIDTLKDLILNGKNGMPSLATYDIHTITGVVKAFLMDLRESLVTRVKWRDFIKAGEEADTDSANSLLMVAVTELPEANRDTLAFIISHLQNVAEVQESNANEGLKNIQQTMSKSNLAKVFAPTLIGNSYITTLSVHDQLYAETQKCIRVLSLLLDLPIDYWTNILSKQPDSQSDLTEPSLLEHTTQHNSTHRRISIGNRPFSGMVEIKGTMTPLKQDPSKVNEIRRPVRQVRKLKPLF